jgi:hypothetical protein
VENVQVEQVCNLFNAQLERLCHQVEQVCNLFDAQLGKLCHQGLGKWETA